jgi:hypothetical protein
MQRPVQVGTPIQFLHGVVLLIEVRKTRCLRPLDAEDQSEMSFSYSEDRISRT